MTAVFNIIGIVTVCVVILGLGALAYAVITAVDEDELYPNHKRNSNESAEETY